MLCIDPILKKVYALGILPVIKIEDASSAPALAGALINGGLPAAEVTFRTAAAADAIRAMHERFPDMLICAGTVLTPEQAKAAADAGASFIVSPGLNPKVVRYCLDHGIPVIPGCATPSDIEQAIELGLSAVKFFPAEANGGAAAIKAVSAPYPQMRFMPTGGVNLANLPAYLSNKKVLCCGGSFMVPGETLAEGDYEKITRLTAEAVRAVHGFALRSLPVSGDEDLLSSLLPIEGTLPAVSVRSAARLSAYLSLMGISYTPCGENALTALAAGQQILFVEA